MPINKNFNAFMDYRNLGREIYERRIPTRSRIYFRPISRFTRNLPKFWQSLLCKTDISLLKSRARPAEKKLTSRIYRQLNSGRPPNYRICTTEINFQGTNPKYQFTSNIHNLKYTSIN